MTFKNREQTTIDKRWNHLSSCTVGFYCTCIINA